MKIRIGVLGCASIAMRSIIPAIKKLPKDYELVAVASRDIEKAKIFAEKFDCEAIEGYENLIKRKEVDAIYMPLPTGLHYVWIKKAILAGKHVYAEKSFASNFELTKDLVSLADAKNVALMEGFMFQYHSQHQFVMELLRKNEIGEIRHFSAAFCFPPLDPSNFRYDPIVGGGAIMDAAGYTVRSAFMVLGSELKLKSATVKYNNKSSLYGSAFMMGEKGIGISVVFGFDNYYQCEYCILGSKGKIKLLKAYTPRKEEKPVCMVEKQDIKITYNLPACDHFVEALLEFKRVILDSELRINHYRDILLQSEALTEIYNKSLK